MASAAGRPSHRRRELLLTALALAAGLWLAWIDLRPRFDDTGALVMRLVIVPIPLAALSGRRPWLWALLVGAPIPLAELASGGSTASLVALACTALGAAAGWLIALGMRVKTA